MFQPKLADAAYTAAAQSFCYYLGRNMECMSNDIATAKAGQGGQYYATQGQSSCTCDAHTSGKSGIIMISSPGDTADNLMMRGVHEYVHVVQATFGGPQPAWLGEGGAVFFECAAAANKGVHGTSEPTSECFKYGGGRDGIIRSVRRLYGNAEGQKPLGTKWFSLYGQDRTCNTDIPPYEKANPFPAGFNVGTLYVEEPCVLASYYTPYTPMIHVYTPIIHVYIYTSKHPLNTLYTP